jgi:hypothetical protein
VILSMGRLTVLSAKSGLCGNHHNNFRCGQRAVSLNQPQSSCMRSDVALYCGAMLQRVLLSVAPDADRIGN